MKQVTCWQWLINPIIAIEKIGVYWWKRARILGWLRFIFLIGIWRSDATNPMERILKSNSFPLLMGSYSERFCSVLPAIKIESQFFFFYWGNWFLWKILLISSISPLSSSFWPLILKSRFLNGFFARLILSKGEKNDFTS